MKLSLGILLALVVSCSFKTTNQTLKGHEELYSEPDAPKLIELEDNEQRIIIASTNDLHGNYGGEIINFSDEHGENEHSVSIGGREIVSSYFSILRETYKNVVLVDSGDIFSEGSTINDAADFYSENKYDALTVGLRDFNLKVPAGVLNNAELFQKFAATSEVPLLLSNLYELKTARFVEWKGTQSHLIKEVGNAKVGIIGLIPDDIVNLTPVQNRVGLYVENMIESTLRHARLLRSLGAEIVVVLTHQGIGCGKDEAEEAKLPLNKVNFEPKRSKICNLDSVLGEYLNRLPPNLVDVVVGGRNEIKTANIINGTVVLSGYPNGRSFNYLELVVNTKTKKVNPEKTVIHQPVYFCREFFKETHDCYFEDSSIDHSKRVPATFLGKPIEIKSEASILKVRQETEKNISKSMNVFDVDVTYVPQSTGQTQLIVLKIPGRQLSKLLEEDYNHHRSDNWRPSPYIEKNNELIININGLEIDLNKNYRVLSDLEALQNNKMLVKLVNDYKSEVFMNHSWSSLNEDSISTSLAAQAR